MEYHSEFRPPGLEQDLEEISEQWTEETTKLVKKMEVAIKNLLF